MLFKNIFEKTFCIDVDVIDEQLLPRTIQVVVTIYRDFWWFFKQRFHVMVLAITSQTRADFTKYSVQNDYFNFSDVEKNIINELSRIKIMCTSCKIYMGETHE